MMPPRPRTTFDWDRDGIVSVWLGVFEGSESLDEYMEEQFSEDDCAQSLFAADFGIDWYDHNFLEMSYRRELVDAAEILAEFSFSQSYVEDAARSAQALSLDAVNTAVILLDFAYSAVAIPRNQSRKLKFVGAFSYDESSRAVREPVF